MIEKLDVMKDIRNVIDKDGIVHTVANFTAIEKINELVDAVNSIVSVQEKLIDSRFVVETKHEEPADPYTEQRKWIGKLCWVWDDDDDERAFTKLKEIIEDDDDRPFKAFSRWKHCEPVKPDDDIIYKGE